MRNVASLWPLDQNKGTGFQKKSPSNFLTIAGDLNPYPALCFEKRRVFVSIWYELFELSIKK
jgi:hypothetical protein